MANPIWEALGACLFTYSLTAFGAAFVFVLDTHGDPRKTGAVMAIAVGLMLAAVQELLSDCLKESASLGVWSWVPMASGFVVAVLCLVGIDWALSRQQPSADGGSAAAGGAGDGGAAASRSAGKGSSRGAAGAADGGVELVGGSLSNGGPAGNGGDLSDSDADIEQLRHARRMHRSDTDELDQVQLISAPSSSSATPGGASAAAAGGFGSPRSRDRDGERDAATPEEIRRAKLLVFALAVQHIPEALAMGVAFAAAAQPNGSMGAAVSLTIAIGLQDIPEGMAAALVLRRLDMTRRQSFFWGQATGWVQPVSGIVGAVAVLAVKAMLPYALAFAGAAMLFVIVRDMIPDCVTEADRLSPTVLSMLGFVVMTVTSMLFEQLVNATAAS
uniref:Zinc transporter ZIP11 n=1 Tax=Bicosoecida sp. CB-2014 TaxID=1486930 RepID=A0A7S1CPJ3_9STRA|mmetsp:Transcript_5700/g.20461  ORF Transcript_5700/g.20461 Transcript_5700/m.20461 type:complete len:387 (+) Transcript_5700:200-1360(+)